MEQSNFILTNQKASEALQNLFYEINEELLRSDEEIQNELDPIYQELNQEDQKTVSEYFRDQFSNHSFWKTAKYNYQHNQQSNVNFKQIFMKEVQQEKNWQNFINLLKIKEFCEENQIPEILIKTESIQLMQKLKEKLFFIFEFLCILQDEETQQSKLIISFLLQFLYDFDELDQKDQDYLEQIIGSLLNKKVFEFMAYQDSIFFREDQQQLVVSLIQNYQLQNKQLEEIIQEKQLCKQQQSFIILLCTQNLIAPKQNLNDFFCFQLLKIIKQQQNLLLSNKIWKQKILNKLDFLSLNDITQYQLVYFRLLFHFWIQNFNQINLQKEIKLLIEDLKKAKPERKAFFINRFLIKTKKLTIDNLHLFIICYLIFFDPDQTKILRNELYKQYIQKIENNLKIAQKHQQNEIKKIIEINVNNLNQYFKYFKKLSLTQIILLSKDVKNPEFNYLLYFLEYQDENQVKDLLLQIFQNQTLKTRLNVLQQYNQNGKICILKSHEIILLLNLIGSETDKQDIKQIIKLFYITQNFQFLDNFFEIQKCAVNQKNYMPQTINLLNKIDRNQFIVTSIIIGEEQLELIANNCLIQLQKEQKEYFDILVGIVINILYTLKKIKSNSLQLIQMILKYFSKMNIENKSQQYKKYSILKYFINIILIDQKITLKQYQMTLYFIFDLIYNLNSQQNEFKKKQGIQLHEEKQSLINQQNIEILKHLNIMNKNKAYDFDLIYEELQNNTQLELILKMLYIQFIRKNQNSFTSEEVLVHCKKLYHLDCEQYERLYLKLWKDQFQLSPHNVSCYQQFQKLPKHGNIQLYDFNISLSEMSIDEQTHLIENWILQMNDQQLFKCLIPIFFDIIKRGEDSKFFISIINKQLKVKKMDFFFKNGFNMKALFQILYNNSDYELQVMLLKFHCKFNPIPFLYKNLDFDNIKDQDEVYKLNEKLFYIIPDCLTIINFSLNSKQKSFGKTMLINQIFYQMNKFEICDKCEINNSTIDIMFDYSFSGSRQFAIADTHGIIPESMLLKILPFFQIWIIQMNSEKELIETYENLKKLISSLNNLQNSPKFCLVIRNSTESIDKLKSNQKYHEIFKFTQQIHCVQNLTQQDITKNQYDDELEEFQKFIFEIISQASFGNRIQNQNAFLEIIKKFNYENIQLQKQREDEIIINLEKQLKVLIDKPDGFYNKDSFPLRALDYQILKLNEEKNNLQQQNQINNSIKINQIQKEITQLENSIKDLQFTDILNLFCDIFSRNNSYILYLSFVEKLRIFNEVNSNLIQDQVQSLNEKLQILKKNRKALRQNDQQIVEQDDQSKKLKEEIKQIDEELKEQLKRISERNIGIELFWREVISIQNKSVFKKKQINPVDVVYELIKKGEPFEFLDGDQLKIDQQFLKQLIYKFSKQGEEKVLVLSVLGPQSSGKSMILNKIFGCHFWTSVGRCTKGIYLQLLKIQQKNQFDNLFDYILLLDTEGLQNPNQKDPEFDKKIALFVLSISDITLINVKGDIHQQFKNLVEMCIFTFGQMKSVISANKQLSWCFNQNNDVNNFAPFLDQLQGIASNLNIEFSQTEQESESQNIDYNEILDIKKENIQILGFASTERSWQNTSLGMKQNWRQLIINETFCQEAYQYGIRLIKNFVSKIKQLGNDDNSISSLHSFIQNIETHWQSICRLPDLLEFTELKQYKQDELMKNSLDQNYKSQNFYFIENLPHEIQNHLNQQKEKNLSTFQQFQMLKEKEVIAQFDQIKTQIKELLFKIKQEQKISKKIFIKYQNRLTQKIQSQIEECKVTIYSQVKNHETKFQEIKGFSQNEKFVSDISANPQELKQLQKYPNEIEDKFKNKWEQIINDYNQQILNIFNEYSKKQYTSISYSFDQYRLQTKREQEIQDKFINDINKNSLFNNQNNEKNKIFNIFREELKEQQFILLDSTKNITVYGDIFSQPIIEKLKKAKETDLININNFYKVQLEYYIIKKVELEKYLNKGGLYFDFSQKYRIYEQQRQNLKSYIFKFLLIINQFRLIFNQTYYDDLIKAIDIPRKVYESSKSYDQIVLKLFENLSQTFIVPADKIVLNNQEFFQSLKLNYGYLYYVQYKIELNNFNECQQFLQKKIQDDEILLYHSNKIIPKDNQNQSLEYIANQNCKYQKKAFSNSFVEFFSKQMMEKKGWEKLYFQLYDIIYQEMRSNYQIIYKNSQMDSDQELGSANCKLIQIIMSKIKSQIQQFNKQFAIFGITLSDIGERCIYYYSMILIWRFSCYQKWKTLEEGHNNLQKLYPIQFEKFKAQILQNKVQQSSIKAKSLSDAIYQAYINYFYFDNQIKVKNLIKAKIINCYQIIKELDRKLLENYNKNLDENMKIEIFNYITDQKNFIENQVKIQIKQIQEQLKQDFQQQLRDGLTNYLLILKSNIEIILNNIQNQQMYGNKVNEFFESHEQDSRKDLEFEQMMFKLIQPCIFGVQEQNPILNKIKRKFQGIFYHEQYRSIFPQLNLLVLKQEEEIQQLKPYIQQLLTEFNENLRKCQNEILRIDIFDINSEFDEMKLNMIGCIESCPFCNRKCDEPNDNNHRHKCKNGHQLGGMNYVLLKDKPSLLICEEIKDDQILKTQDSTIFRTWKDMKKMYKEWDFDLLTNLEDKDKIKNKMMNVWNGGIGLLVCNFLTQKYGKKIQFINKNEFELTNIHYIIVLDDSQSMQGTRFENAKQGCLNCMKNMQKNPSARISLIIFNSKARVQIDCQQVNIRDQSNKFTYQNGGTNFENAFIEVYNLILKHQNQKFNKHVILFYTDGEAAYPKNAINKFIALSQEQKQAISLYTCTLDNSPITLQLMIQELKNNGFKAKLQKNIEVNQIQSVWTEIIQKGIHVKE